jgi:diguanylate cyclase (GGDEF)-like protein
LSGKNAVNYLRNRKTLAESQYLPTFQSIRVNMNQTKQNIDTRAENADFGAFNFTLIVASIGALTATFALGYANLGFAGKIIVFAAIVTVYLSLCAAIYFRREAKDAGNEPETTIFDSEIENRLRALDEASEFFGATLKPADMFRLIASRVNELLPFAVGVLFFVDESGTKLKIEYADGENAQMWKTIVINSNEGAAGKAFSSRRVEFDGKLALEKAVLMPALLQDFQSAAAVPLARSNEIFAVFQLYFTGKKQFDRQTRALLEAVGERIAPLMASSLSFERSLSNALTDALTNLPNQRAFFLVLENQIAESARYQSERALSMLAMDIADFDELNRKFGHATADRVLAFAGEIIKAQLRQMDFLARSGSDELLAVLPTAAGSVAAEIIERIERAFAEKYFDINGTEKVFVKLNFGAATFGADGETASQLLKTAVARKQQRKSDEAGKILWFPKEYVD